MSIDLPPSSSFAPDPAFARARSFSKSNTLTLPTWRRAVHSTREPMSGTIAMGSVRQCEAGLRAAIVSVDEAALTITF